VAPADRLRQQQVAAALAEKMATARGEADAAPTTKDAGLFGLTQLPNTQKTKNSVSTL
jgi:hypothetical protein